MKIRILMALLLQLMAISSLCSVGVAFEDISLSAEAVGSDYFPMTKGSEWTYERKDKYPDGSVERSYYIRTVVGSFDTLTLIKELWSEDIDGITYLGGVDRWYFVESGMVAMKKYSIWWSYETPVYSNGYPLLPAIMKKGSSKTVTGKVTTDTESYAYKATVKVEKFETLKVGAGTFKTAKIKVVFTSGAEAPSTSYYWYAQGVGMIKAVTQGTNAEITRTLKRYKLK